PAGNNGAATPAGNNGAATPAGDDAAATPAGRIGTRQAGAWLTPPVERMSPPQPGAVGPPQVRMSLAA
ncbi:MAG: hypothetical protein LBV78_11050, partial [Kitasatospora sp.]|nr:hypothetical protein [Kitasatospora sp.]